jgi:hypothetical protein
MAKVYLETSFFSACVWDRKDAMSIARQDESRRRWFSSDTTIAFAFVPRC